VSEARANLVYACARTLLEGLRGIPVPLGGRALEVVTVRSAIGQCVYRARLAMHGVGDKLADIVEPERGQDNLLDPCSSVTDRAQCSDERVRTVDLLVSVRPDQQQTPNLRMREISRKTPARRRLPDCDPISHASAKGLRAVEIVLDAGVLGQMRQLFWLGSCLCRNVTSISTARRLWPPDSCSIVAVKLPALICWSASGNAQGCHGYK
jgi:hypothetical protein